MFFTNISTMCIKEDRVEAGVGFVYKDWMILLAVLLRQGQYV